MLLLPFYSTNFECVTYCVCYKIYLIEVYILWVSSFNVSLPWRFKIQVFTADGVLCRTLLRKGCSNTKEERIQKKKRTAKTITDMKRCLLWKKRSGTRATFAVFVLLLNFVCCMIQALCTRSASPQRLRSVIKK